MKKIFLISTSLEEEFKITSINDDDNSYGVGLAYLHSVIEQAGYNIRTKNYNTADENASMDDIIFNLHNFEPDYLLLQLFTMNRITSYNVIKLARNFNKDIKIIVGGVHATIMYYQLLKHFDIDYVVLGEGEETIIDLLNTIDNKGNISNVKGIAYKIKDNIIKNDERELIQNLDELPFPKHELFIKSKRKMACILTSRGCPFKCSFCCLHTISKRKFRTRTAANVIAEVEYIINNFKNIQTIQILDDTFTLNQQRVFEFCNKIIEKKIKINFICSARFKPASREMFEIMEKAGFTDIGFGLETGSEKLLHTIHKNITKDDVRKVYEMLKNTKIKVGNFLIIGFPGESVETVNETINFIKELQKIKYFELHGGVTPLWVYPNTEIYEMMKAKGVIDDDYWLTDKNVPNYILEHSYEDLIRMAYKIQWSSFSLKSKLQFVLRKAMSLYRNPIRGTKKILYFTKKISSF